MGAKSLVRTLQPGMVVTHSESTIRAVMSTETSDQDLEEDLESEGEDDFAWMRTF
jgi:hypothetical protein